MNLFQKQYRIPSARAQWHSYDGGLYFVTICTANKAHYFGEIHDDVMQFSAVGLIAEENINNIPRHYPYAEIPLHVVMPNHIHLIVYINGEQAQDQRRNVGNTPNNTLKTKEEISRMQGWLSVVVGGLKAAITKCAKERGLEFGWQTRFHDHIIRNNRDLNTLAEYIKNNVVKWATDRYYQ